MKSLVAKYFSRVFLFITFILFSFITTAGSFQLLETNATTTGDFHSGGAADISNVSTETYNPAILAAIHHQQVSFGGVAIIANSDFNGTVQGGHTMLMLPPPPVYHTPAGGIVTEADNVIPNFHYVLPFQNQRMALGVGLISLYGLETNYGGLSPMWTQAATFSQLVTLDFNPSLAALITKHISVGVGLDFVYADAHYNNNVLLPFMPISTALSFKNNLDGYGVGYNVGILFLITPRTRIGASYRSEIDINVAGESSLGNATMTFPKTRTTTRLPLPPLAIFSIVHEFNKKFSMMFSAYWTGWHVFNTLRLNNSALQALTFPGFVLVIPENYHDAWMYTVGMHYLLTKKVLFKMGVAYDETPTTNKYRDIRLPDSNRFYIAGGIHIYASKKVGIDLGYAHVFFTRADVNNSKTSAGSASPPLGPVIPTTVGTSRSSANVVGIQFTYNIS